MPKHEFPTEADLVDGLVMDDYDIPDDAIIDKCMSHPKFNHTREEWLEIIRQWRASYKRTAASISVSLEHVRIV